MPGLLPDQIDDEQLRKLQMRTPGLMPNVVPAAPTGTGVTSLSDMAGISNAIATPPTPPPPGPGTVTGLELKAPQGRPKPPKPTTAIYVDMKETRVPERIPYSSSQGLMPAASGDVQPNGPPAGLMPTIAAGGAPQMVAQPLRGEIGYSTP